MAADFTGTIEVGYNTDLWGPYVFTFPVATSATANDGIVPFGDTIASAVIRAFVGKVTRKSTLSGETEVSTDVVDTAYNVALAGIIVDGNLVKAKFQYPSDTTYKGNKCTIIIEVTLSSGATKSFYYQYLYIR